jgi:hypothetical protein
MQTTEARAHLSINFLNSDRFIGVYDVDMAYCKPLKITLVLIVSYHAKFLIIVEHLVAREFLCICSCVTNVLYPDSPFLESIVIISSFLQNSLFWNQIHILIKYCVQRKSPFI